MKKPYKVEYMSTVEMGVMNKDYAGLRIARLETWGNDDTEHYHREPGRIEVWNDDEYFNAVRDYIELGHCPFCEPIKAIQRFIWNWKLTRYQIINNIRKWIKRNVKKIVNI
jgi:hypothetical protein